MDAGNGVGSVVGMAGLTREDIMTADEVADLLRVKVSTVGDWARAGKIPSRRIGKTRLFIRAEIEKRLISDRPFEPGASGRAETGL